MSLLRSRRREKGKKQGEGEGREEAKRREGCAIPVQ